MVYYRKIPSRFSKEIIQIIRQIRYIQNLFEKSNNILFVQMCKKYLVQKLFYFGLIESKSAFLLKNIGHKNFIDRSLYVILKKKYKKLSFRRYLELIKKKKILIGLKPVKQPFTLISKHEERNIFSDNDY